VVSDILGLGLTVHVECSNSDLFCLASTDYGITTYVLVFYVLGLASKGKIYFQFFRYVFFWRSSLSHKSQAQQLHGQLSLFDNVSPFIL
jgi:hypothetical protein